MDTRQVMDQCNAWFTRIHRASRVTHMMDASEHIPPRDDAEVRIRAYYVRIDNQSNRLRTCVLRHHPHLPDTCNNIIMRMESGDKVIWCIRYADE